MNRSVVSVRARVLSLLLLFSCVQAAFAQVRLSEVLANNNTITTADGKKSDYVELHNAGGTAVDLSGASLSDDPAVPRKWVFPAGSQIGAGQRLVVLLDSGAVASTQAGPALNAGFGVNDKGDQVYFYAAPAAGGQLLDSVTFGLQLANYSIGRAPDNWTLTLPSPGQANTAVPLGSPTGLKVNEIMADPANGDDWFEIMNTSTAIVPLGGLALTDNPVNNPRLSPIPALSFIGTGDDAFIRFWADQDVAAGADHAFFRLSAGGESVAIVNANSQVIDTVTFGAQQTGVSQGRMPNGTGGLVSFPGSASPGEPNYTIYRNIVVNEVLTHSDPPYSDAVEFYNTTGSPIDISGWFLSDKRTDPKRYRFPAGSVIPANGYLVVYEYQFNGAVNNVTVFTPFSLDSAEGDQIYLFQSDASGNLSGARVEERFEAAANAVSFGRFGTPASGDYKFVAMNQTTFGKDNPASLGEFVTGTGLSNAYPRVGPVVISEVMYHPPDIGTNDNVIDEFVELRNISFDAVPLFHPTQTTNKWRLQGGVQFDFPGNITLQPGATLVVVNFDPATNATTTAAWRSKYNVPAEAVLVGPYRGKLSNGSDEVELYRPDDAQLPPSPNAGFVPYIRVDKINYNDAVPTPWPTGADATGQSLTRRNDFLFGNDPANWMAAPPTPGRVNNTTAFDSDADGMSDQFESAYQLHPLKNTDAGVDLDNDSFTNLQEAQAGTNPRNAGSRPGGGAEIRITAILLNPIRIQFTAQANTTYTVQYRDNLATGTWQNLENVPSGLRSRTVEITDPNPTAQRRFYRVISPAR
ncbi:MAG TPA: lamin tail domain-containing protein [Methylomirabilota bacterium]|nr:lamin tail domain-containing protein [Methylomirabilota bacterium]